MSGLLIQKVHWLQSYVLFVISDLRYAQSELMYPYVHICEQDADAANTDTMTPSTTEWSETHRGMYGWQVYW